jgi:hypothetical protein
MTPPLRLLALALAVSGCTVIAPDLHVTSVSFPTVVANAPTATEEPWPSHGPSSAPTAAPTAPRTFSGQGPDARIGPVSLPSGKIKLHVVFETSVVPEGAFALELDDAYGRYQADLVSGASSFDRVLNPTIAISGDHYLNVTTAEGRWTIEVD